MLLHYIPNFPSSEEECNAEFPAEYIQLLRRSMGVLKPLGFFAEIYVLVSYFTYLVSKLFHWFKSK